MKETIHNEEMSRNSEYHDESDRESTDPTGVTGTESRGDRTVRSDRDRLLRERIVKSEERAVQKARLLVIATVVALTLSVSTAVYFFATKSDQASFELAYRGFVSDIISLVQWENQYNFALMEQLAASVTSAAKMTNSSFPYITLPFYEITGGFVDGMGGILTASFSPLVKATEQEKWEEYSIRNQGWLENSELLKSIDQSHQDALHGTIQDHEHDRLLQQSTSTVHSVVYQWVNNVKVRVTSSPNQMLAPLWQISPPDISSVNADLLQDKSIQELYEQMLIMKHPVLSPSIQLHNLFSFLYTPEEEPLKQFPHAYILQPVYDNFDKSNATLVGLLVAVTTFENLLDKILPADSRGIVCVIRDSCGNVITYNLEGQNARFLGYEDLHDRAFEAYKHSTTVELYQNATDDLCVHTLDVYASKSLQEAYKTNKPAVYTSVVVLAFVVTSVLILVYDVAVTRRQEKTMTSAIRSGKLVASLFPSNVVERIMEDAQTQDKQEPTQTAVDHSVNLTAEEQHHDFCFKTRPIAEFFPNTTIMFADIAGFTAWASTREPFQVFQLLETLYSALDRIAKARGVFKVETVGDCYVAVCGLPNPCKDHAITMCRFARDCHAKMKVLTRKLEVVLGPDTADLAFRIGLHSGPVTGGVLRGDNARFQLFGDTMNTASRIESTGEMCRTHLSSSTAQLLVAGNKEHWIKPRDEVVFAKGKGKLKTFWLTLHCAEGSTTSSTDSASVHDVDVESIVVAQVPEGLPLFHTEKVKYKSEGTMPLSRDGRLIDWNVAVLQDRLMAVAAQRHHIDVSRVNISAEVHSQLRDFIVGIASMYQKNPFHNFMHASHVTMSVTKILSRVVSFEEQTASNRYTTGITSDALTPFAAVFSALIHDVDHPGVPNARLVIEGAATAAMYNNKSIAENNSIDVALKFFMLPNFETLRDFIFSSPAELERFQSLVQQIVLATDIVDPDLKRDRNERWSRAFGQVDAIVPESSCTTDRIKAMIVLEHLIQASDVVHTMQHWHVYIKWNFCFFRETFQAYQGGRADRNPADYWYKGEIGFFDLYVIPLAKKLHECEVFGVSSDEFLNYAVNNRNEWEVKGRGIVKEFVEKICGQVQSDGLGKAGYNEPNY